MTILPVDNFPQDNLASWQFVTWQFYQLTICQLTILAVDNLASWQFASWQFCQVAICQLTVLQFISLHLNPIPAGTTGGGQIDPPCSFFLHNSKSIGLRLLKFSDFSYIPKALPSGLKPGFNTNCLNPQAHCLKDCFFL